MQPHDTRVRPENPVRLPGLRGRLDAAARHADGIRLRPIYWLGIAAACFVAGCVVGCVAAVVAREAVSVGRAPSPESALPVTTEEMVSAYRSNPAAADGKYLGKWVRVKSRAVYVTAAGDGYEMGLDTGPNVYPDGKTYKSAVACFFPAGAREEVAKIKDFDSVDVLARVKSSADRVPGRLHGRLIALEDCRIVEHTPFK